MRASRYIAFEGFYLDTVDERLWQGEAHVPLGHKAFVLLAHLARQPNQLWTKDDLLASVWPDVAVGDAVLTTAVREIRHAIGDVARTPRFIQTVHGRGYRFIAPTGQREQPATASRPAPVGLVGRDAELARLWEWYSSVQQGARRIGFIAGEAGIGKTSLIDAFIAAIATRTPVRVARGQCVEQYGGGEPYLPILEALSRLGRAPDDVIRDVLREHAPTWLAHLPALAGEITPSAATVRPERMLRELAEALEALAAIEPLILVLDDLHWSDRATLEWLGYLARRRDPARLLVLGLYRPVDARLHRGALHDLLVELRHQPQIGEMVLEYLSEEAVHAYVRQRAGAGAGATSDRLGTLLHRRTGGHPLFVASIVDGLMEQRAGERSLPAALDLTSLARAIPPTVRQFIEHRLQQIPDAERSILDAASVAGNPFSVAAVADAGPWPQPLVDATCAAWTRDLHILDADGVATWPDGTIAARYRFRHDLFHEVAYARISPDRRAQLHHAIGGRLEAAHRERAPSIAAELAVHFDQGRDRARALTWLEQAARNALSRSAYVEADAHLDRAGQIAMSLAEGRARLASETALSLLRAQVLAAIRGWGADDVAQAYARAHALSVARRDEPRQLQATWGLIASSIVRSDLSTAQTRCRRLLALASKRKDTLFTMAAHAELGGTALMRAQPAVARRHFRLAETLADRSAADASLAAFGVDMGVFARIWSTHALWYDGRADDARQRAAEVLDLPTARNHAFTRTVAMAYSAMLHQFVGDASEVERMASATIVEAVEHGFPYYRAWAEVLRGWSRATRGAGEEAVDEIHRAIAVLRANARLRLPYYLCLLADAYGRIGRIDDGLTVVGEALSEIGDTGERWWEAELHRTRGVLLGIAANAAEAERCFCRAMTLAQRQRAKALEQRAAISLAALRRGPRSATRGRRPTRPRRG